MQVEIEIFLLQTKSYNDLFEVTNCNKGLKKPSL